MSANVESMFYYNLDENGNRFVPWHGLGTAVDKCLNSAEALTAAGLDWQVVPKPVFDGLFFVFYPQSVNCARRKRCCRFHFSIVSLGKNGANHVLLS